MLLHIPQVLTPEQVRAIRQSLDGANWTDGRATAGAQAVRVKDNLQLHSGSLLAVQLAAQVSQALSFSDDALPPELEGFTL